MARKREREETPSSVVIKNEPRPHVRDATLGIHVDVDRDGEPANRLVTIGDSITQGFMSAAVHQTDRSWPAIVAHELALVGDQFRYPVYEPPSGPGGLPFDLERALRNLGQVVGDELSWRELIKAGLWLRGYMDRIEDYWEGRGADRFQPVTPAAPYHNLAVYGADLLDVQLIDSAVIDGRLKARPHDDLFDQLVEHDNDRAWKVVLDSCGPASTVLDAARAMGAEGPGAHGIETLVVMLGANNALGGVVKLDPRWTPDDYLAEADPRARLDTKGRYNVWQPPHFDAEWASLVTRLQAIDARHVIVATVPQVTIAPIARGVRDKIRRGSRYFPYYTRPWITDPDFEVARDPWIDADEARAIDSAIDAFNETIITTVRDARRAGRDWYLFDLGGLLDSLAVKRYLLDPAARPPWWQPYDLPPVLAALQPPLDTTFFRAGPGGRLQGGLFSLDGVHPTTSAAGVVAREVIRIMDGAGVEFRAADGSVRPSGTVDVDFARILTLDTLNSRPPTAIASTLSLLGWLDEKLDWVSRSIGR
jgi:hypothetical protein